MKLIELEDHHWFPDILRKYQIDFIAFVVNLVNIYDQILQKRPITNANTIIDLCAGNGVVSNQFSDAWGKNLIKTDKFPYSADIKPLDVMECEFTNDFIYIMTNAFHHFDDVNKLSILYGMKSAKSEFYFMEILEPNLFSLTKVFITTTIGQLVFTPFLKPFSIKRLLFTYIIPINIFTVTFDGIVSILKSKTVNNYRKLIQGIPNNQYEITVTKLTDKYFNSVILIKGNPIIK